MSASKMVLSDLYRSQRSKLYRLRHCHHPASKLDLEPSPCPTADLSNTLELSDPYTHPDLLSNDKVKQKDAIRQYLHGLVKNDWDFVWARDDELHAADQAKSGDLAGRVVDESDDNRSSSSSYSSMSEDLAHFRSRVEWASDYSDVELAVIETPVCALAATGSPKAAQVAHATRDCRRRAIRREMRWNDGLACFEARRNAWTGARIFRVRTKFSCKPVASRQQASPALSLSSLSPRSLFSRYSHPSTDDSILDSNTPTLKAVMSTPPFNTNSPSAVFDAFDPLRQQPSADGRGHRRIHSHSSAGMRFRDGDQTLDLTDSTTTTPLVANMSAVETLVRIPRPLLPPANHMRASISPAVYLSIYDKVIIQNLTPSCPVNLSDVVCSCVVGWKRDGEWPPRALATGKSGNASSTTMATSLSLVGSRESKRSVDAEGRPGSSRRKSFGFLSRSDHDPKDVNEPHEHTTGRGVRRSLQRVLGIGIYPAVQQREASNENAP